jgi:signal transduction histidine kinase
MTQVIDNMPVQAKRYLVALSFTVAMFLAVTGHLTSSFVFSGVFYTLMVVVLGGGENTDRKRTVARVAGTTGHQDLEVELLEISEWERQRIGQDLHDGHCQRLVAVGIAGSLLERKLAALSLPEAAEAGEISRQLRLALAECRQVIRELYPVELAEHGLKTALEQLALRVESQSGIPCRFLCHQEIPVLDSATALHLYRIAQESVNNAIKHACSTSIHMALTMTGSLIILIVKDDGLGIPQPSGRRDGMGLRIMAHRATSIGAVLSIQPNGNKGTQVICAMPRHETKPSGNREESSDEWKTAA